MRVLIGQRRIDHKMVASKAENNTEIIIIKQCRINVEIALFGIEKYQCHRESLVTVNHTADHIGRFTAIKSGLQNIELNLLRCTIKFRHHLLIKHRHNTIEIQLNILSG